MQWRHLSLLLFGLSLCLLLTALNTLNGAFRSQFRKPTLDICVSAAPLSFSIPSLNTVSVWGEGCAITMDCTRTTSVVKTHGDEPGLVLGPRNTHSVRKRSYVRALNRAQRFGFSWYRGQLLTSNTCSSDSQRAPSAPTATPPPMRTSGIKRPRLQVFSWNSGGLAPAKWDHLQQWLHGQALDMVSIQETHWNFSRNWTTSEFHCIHSGASSKQAGILCLVSKKVCNADQLSWMEIEPGRLLHVRIHGKHRSMDFLHIYQHVHSVDKLDTRQHFWDQLNHQLTVLPKRNFLTLLGDFNTSLATRSLAVGVGTYQHHGVRSKGTTHQDSDILHQLLRQHSIQALNTWNTDNCATFVHGSHHSRIDFICCRRLHADCTSRQAQCLTNFPLLSPSGAQHLPLMTSLMRCWTPRPTQSSTHWSHKQRLALYAATREQGFVASKMKCELQEQLRQLPATPDLLDSVHQALNMYPPSFSTPTPKPVHQFDITPFQRFQYHSQQLRELAYSSTMKTTFLAWFHVSQLHRARHQMNRTAKMARRAKLETIFTQAREAEQAKDHFRLYQAVRQIAPKITSPNFQLRLGNGQIATAQEAADILNDWYENMYKAPQTTSSVIHTQWPFNQQELAQGFEQMPMMKALAPQFAPAPFWTMCADDLAELLHPYLISLCLTQTLPQVWGLGHLKLLLKPGRKGDRPGDLRPIALLEPTGKLIMGLIAKQLLVGSWWLLQTLPQFAYLPRRSCHDAIHRILNHCHLVRTTLDSMKYRLQSLAAGTDLPPFFGGFLLSLDLSRAFDEVDRSRLFRALHELGTDPQIINILQQVYDSSQFEFVYKGEYRKFRTQKGIRQGCKAAPILWNIYTADLVTTLADLISWNFVIQHLTLYADDMCQHQHFSSVAEFQTAIQRAGQLMDVIENAGLPINTDKTVALCRFSGTHSALITKKYILRTKTGTFLCIPRADSGPSKIKLVKDCTYLGVKISYGAFERLTIQHRLNAGSRTQASLHKWLHLKTGLHPKQRLKIWRQCVFSSMTHGLFATGFTQQDLVLLHRQCMKQIRRIFKEPVFITRESHQQFLHRHHLDDPLQLLRKLCLQAQRRDLHRWDTAESDDILLSTTAPDYDHFLQVIDLALQHCSRDRHPPQPERPDTVFHCSDCHLIFRTLITLRKHQTTVHGLFRGAIRPCTPMDMHRGLPTCQRCFAKFTTWHQFRHHVRFVCPFALQDLASDEHEHRLRVAEFMQFSNAANFQALKDQAELLAHFQSHCILCNKFFLTSRGMMHHWASDHPEVFSQHGPALETIKAVYQPHTPCELCGHEFKRQHHCIILGQAAMCNTAHAPPPVQVHSSPTVLFTCDFCHKAYVTRHGLRDHILKYHQTLEADPTADLPTTSQLHQQFMQAVMDNDVTTLLQDEQVLSYLGVTCSLCSKTFAKRHILTRHLRHHHSSIWTQCESDINEMNQYHRPFGKCFCAPVLSRARHVCAVFQQFQMARHDLLRSTDGQHGFAPGLAGESLPLGPAAVATPQEHAVALLFHGQVDQLYSRADMRMVLTVHCLFCTQTFRSGDDLLAHLAEKHRELWLVSKDTMDFFRWHFFSKSGCMCNPSPCAGDHEHQCAPLRQLSMLFHDFGMPVCLPFSYSAKDLMDLLMPLLTFPACQFVTRSMMLRQFGKLWQYRELNAVLKTTCLICQEPMQIGQLTAHLEVAHDMPLKRFRYHMLQLAQVFVALQSDDFACDFCGTNIQVTSGYRSVNSQMLRHLTLCPLVQQYAVLLTHPLWESSWSECISWPSQDVLLMHHRRREGRQWQLNVPLLDHPSSITAQCGYPYLEDEVIRQSLSTTCLLCGKFFISAWQFMRHLFDHNFHQMDTEHCHSLLVTLHSQLPCVLCGSISHSKAPGRRCVALFNLAVFLCNSYGLDRGRAADYEPDCRDLEAYPGFSSAEESDDASRGQGRTSRGITKRQKTAHQQKSWERPGQGERQTQASITGDSDRHHQCAEATSPSTRGHDQCPAHGISVSDPLQPGGGIDHSGHAPGLNGLAESEGQTCPPSPSPGHHDDEHTPQAPDSSGQCLPYGCNSPGLCEVPPGERPGSNAISGMELSDKNVGAHQGQATGSAGDTSLHHQHPAPSLRPGSDSTLPFIEAIRRSSDQSDSMAMGGLTEKQSRALARGQDLMLPFFLAVGHGQSETSGTTEISTGSEAHSSMRRFALRILLNLNGCMCFANSALLSLCWMAIIADAMTPSMWLHGFELIQLMTAWTPIPLDLRSCAAMHALFMGTLWGLTDLDRQQDLTEFLTFLLLHLQPSFIHNGWLTRPEHVDPSSDTRLHEEKGTRFNPVHLSIDSDTADSITFQFLIDTWHDALGLCKAFEQAAAVRCFMIDRVSTVDGSKLTHKIDIGTGTVTLPLFTITGDIELLTYHITALVYHIGVRSTSGHYRCIVRSNGVWYDYDDGSLPTRYDQLPSDTLRKVCFIWVSDRTQQPASSSQPLSTTAATGQ